MASTEGGDTWQVTACSTAGVSGSGPCAANASTLIGMGWNSQSGAHEPERDESLLGYLRDKGKRALEGTDPPSVPEPSSYALLLVGMLAVAGRSVGKRLATQKV